MIVALMEPILTHRGWSPPITYIYRSYVVGTLKRCDHQLCVRGTRPGVSPRTLLAVAQGRKFQAPSYCQAIACHRQHWKKDKRVRLIRSNLPCVPCRIVLSAIAVYRKTPRSGHAPNNVISTSATASGRCSSRWNMAPAFEFCTQPPAAGLLHFVHLYLTRRWYNRRIYGVHSKGSSTANGVEGTTQWSGPPTNKV